MAFFEWDASLDVNVNEMNEQHKTLIGLMQVLYDKSESGVFSKDEVNACLDDLVNYVIQHFADEEKYMASIQFPGLSAHQQIHGHLLTDLGRLVTNFKQGTSAKISAEFVIFLKFWLSTHIRGIDTKYGEHNK